MSIKMFFGNCSVCLITNNGRGSVWSSLFCVIYEVILKQADRIVSRKYWTREERKMYDERTRYIQAYLGHLATVEKEKKDAKMEGLAEGIEKGIETGKAHGIEHGKKMILKR